MGTDLSPGVTELLVFKGVTIDTELALSVSCNSALTGVVQCSDTNAECTSTGGNVCRCKTDYFDSNGYNTADGTCTSMSDLKVTSVTIEQGTETVNVTWTPPTDTSQVNKYQVIWSRSTSSGTSYDVLNTASSTSISGFTSGEPYTFNVKTFESGSRTSTQEIESDSPSTVAMMAVLKVTSVTDTLVTTTGVTISWTESATPSQVSSYTVTWTQGGNPLGSLSAGKATSAAITGLSQSTTYVFKVTSIESGSRLTPQQIESDDSATVTTKAELSQPCGTILCGDVNSECTAGNVCRCKSGYYDNNGYSTSGGVCTDMSGLVVTSLSVGVEGTSTVTITWNAPSPGVDQVSRYEVHWTPVLSNRTSSYDAAKTTSVRLTGFVSGQMYNFSVKSIEDGSRSSPQEVQTSGTSITINAGLTVGCGDGVNCADSNSECVQDDAGTTNVCRCKSGYFDSNGYSTAGGMCVTMSTLAVTDITLVKEGTDTVSISWTPPTEYTDQVNSYRVSWSPAATINGNSFYDAQLTMAVQLVGFTPGQTYTFSVISVESGSRTSDQITQVSASPITMMPATPTSFLVTDVDGPTIVLSWTLPSGIKTSYDVITTPSLSPTNTATESITYSTGVIDGQRYNISITTVSGSEGSDPLVATFRTVSKISGSERSDPLVATFRTVSKISGSERSDPLVATFRTVSKISGSERSDPLVATFRTVSKSDGHTNTHYVITDQEGDGHSNTTYVITDPEGDGHTNTTYVITDQEGDGHTNTTYVITDQEGDGHTNTTYVITDQEGDGHTNTTYVITDQEGDGHPNTTYVITDQEGDGHRNTLYVITDQEVPQSPSTLTATVVSSTEIRVSWAISGPEPGPTTYTLNVIPDSPETSRLETVIGFSTTTLLVTSLEEYRTYTFNLTTSTIKGTAAYGGPSLPSAKTNAAAPGLVENFVVARPDGPNFTTVTVSWGLPSVLQRNSDITKFMFLHNTTGGNLNSGPEEIPVVDTVTRNLAVVPQTTYYIEVYAVGTDLTPTEYIGVKSSTSYIAPAGPPPLDVGETVIPSSSNTNIQATQTSFTLSLTDGFFTNELYGTITDLAVVLCKDPCSSLDSSSTAVDSDYLTNINGWKAAKSSGYAKEYRAMSKTAFTSLLSQASTTGRRKRSTNTFVVVIGTATDCDSSSETYCNGPLEAGSTYYLKGVVCTEGGCTLSTLYGPYVTEQVPDPGPDFGVIVGVVCGIVAFALVVVIIVVFMKRRQSSKRNDDFDDDDRLDTINVEVEKKHIPAKRPVIMERFPQHVADLHKDSKLKFAKEYEDLKELSAKHPCNAANEDGNKLKNRYVNILPFDHSRVKLNPTDPEDLSTDFINANYIPGYNSPREYIASQGPIPSTIDDFWRMIWEQNVAICVMLTLCKEDGRIKCEQYWPMERNEPKQYGDIVVEITSCSTVNTYDYRIFKLTQGDQIRTLKHFHFLNWKDFSANVQNDVMIDFIQNVRAHIQPPDKEGPMIIHCSAGVGRTGTYMALDQLIQFIEEHDFSEKIDIFDLVLSMRNYRVFMVQTEQQYVFIHDCAKDLIERKKARLQNDEEDDMYVNKAFNQDEDENLYQNTNFQHNTTAKTEL
ncbi:receptor-type tyrosine-protein phosphatase eta-like [Argopecten irradians]|uniref:receptor-type tyrosine-protein phosphatase eta-like n=1 Tax=Argopecten irradians TaxID=31199 RepID=UPI003723F381